MAAGGNRLLTIAAAAGSLVLLAVVVLMLWPADPMDETFGSGRPRIDGETIGWVSKVESNIIHVNSGPFGGGVVPLVVTKFTRITVGAKEGWFEDIRPGGQVKVAYELYHGRRFARSVELLVDEGTRRPARATPHLRSTAGAPAKPSAPGTGTRPAPAAAAPAAHPVVAPPTPAPRVEPIAPASTRPPAVEAVPAPPRASGPPPARNVSAPEAPRPPASPAPRAGDPPGAAEGGEGTDGSAAVDWLLKSRR